MTEIQTTFKEIDKNFPVPDVIPFQKEPEYKYLEIEVTKALFSTVFLKVPKNWTYKNINSTIIYKAVIETLTDYDWEDLVV